MARPVDGWHPAFLCGVFYRQLRYYAAKVVSSAQRDSQTVHQDTWVCEGCLGVALVALLFFATQLTLFWCVSLVPGGGLVCCCLGWEMA